MQKIRSFLVRDPNESTNARNMELFDKFSIPSTIKDYLGGTKRKELQTLLQSIMPGIMDTPLRKIAFNSESKEYRNIITELLKLALQQSFSSTPWPAHCGRGMP
jgi:hypothetical protein